MRLNLTVIIIMSFIVQVAHVNFSSTYNNPDKVMSVNHFYTNVVSLLFAEDVFSSPVEIQNKV